MQPMCWRGCQTRDHRMCHAGRGVSWGCDSEDPADSGETSTSPSAAPENLDEGLARTESHSQR